MLTYVRLATGHRGSFEVQPTFYLEKVVMMRAYGPLVTAGLSAAQSRIVLSHCNMLHLLCLASTAGAYITRQQDHVYMQALRLILHLARIIAQGCRHV